MGENLPCIIYIYIYIYIFIIVRVSFLIFIDDLSSFVNCLFIFFAYFLISYVLLFQFPMSSKVLFLTGF